LTNRIGEMMMLRHALLFSCSILLGSCASQDKRPTQQVAAPPPSDQPQILSVTTSHGKGVPFGQSDSAASFTKLAEISKDATYAYTQGNPARVGGARSRNDLLEKMYLNGLRGPNNEPIQYERMGSCCPFETPNGLLGGQGLLDAFKVTYSGLAKPLIIYIDMYDAAPLYVPSGMIARKASE
jgi:hypothetical protein